MDPPSEGEPSGDDSVDTMDDEEGHETGGESDKSTSWEDLEDTLHDDNNKFNGEDIPTIASPVVQRHGEEHTPSKLLSRACAV